MVCVRLVTSGNQGTQWLPRRLLAQPAMADHWLSCAAAAIMACPSSVQHAHILQIWESGAQQAQMAAIRSAAALLHAPSPPIALPPDDASIEAKTLAAKEEAAGKT